MSTVLITGANRGIGLELTRQLVERGDTVIAAVRSTSPALTELGIRVEAGIDVSDDTLGGLSERLGDVTIDVLINNAGLLEFEHLGDMDLVRIRRQFEINTLGPLKVVLAVLDRMVDGGRIAMITSRMGSLADNTSGGSYGYRVSKAALNMVGVTLAQDLKKRGISVALLHPGFVRTEMTRGSGNIEPAESASNLIQRINGMSLENTGQFWHASGELLPW